MSRRRIAKITESSYQTCRNIISPSCPKQKVVLQKMKFLKFLQSMKLVKFVGSVFRGKSSNSNSINGGTGYDPPFLCNICGEKNPMSTVSRVIGCNHSFCSKCVVELVDLNLRENVSNIVCPKIGCEGKLEPQYYTSILPREVFDRWTAALCEDLVLTSERLYCPYRDCSSLLISDSRGGGVVVQSECPDCHRLFCAQCKVPWHSRVSCGEYQKMKKDDVRVLDSNPQRRSHSDRWVGWVRMTWWSDFLALLSCVYAYVLAKARKNFKGRSSSPNPNTFTCDICDDEKPLSASFRITGCNHSYCSGCVATYIASRLQQNVSNIDCPNVGCKGKLDLQHCRSILPRNVFDRWGDALCEALVSPSEKFYCPFKDCSALLVKDADVATQCECPNCHRLFCAQCKVPWHARKPCKKLKEKEKEGEDKMFLKLANEKKWKRCPKCMFFVQRSSGCLFMTCRCKCTFCYQCGAVTKDHYCKNCNH